MAGAKKIAKKAAGPNEPKGARYRRVVKKRKNLILDQGKIDRAKAIFGVTTETEAIDRALDAVDDLARFRDEVGSGFSDLLGKGGFTDHFPPSRPNAPE